VLGNEDHRQELHEHQEYEQDGGSTKLWLLNNYIITVLSLRHLYHRVKEVRLTKNSF